MKMQELTGCRISIGKTSITVKDENDKTRGIVRNIATWYTMGNRQQSEVWQVLKKCGLWEYSNNMRDEHILKKLIADGNTLYYINDLRYIENYHKYFEGHSCCEQEQKNFQKYMEVLEHIREYMTVIDCYVIW